MVLREHRPRSTGQADEVGAMISAGPGGGKSDQGARRVILIEDHVMLAEALATALAGHGFQAVAVPSSELESERVLRRAGELQPSIALVDLFLGEDQLGLALVEPLRSLGITVIMLTTSHDPILLGECLLAGAYAVLDKAAPFEDLLLAMNATTEGQPALPEARRTEILDAHRRAVAERAATNRRFERLTRREAEVLGKLVEGATAKEAARALGITLPTVRTQIRAVLEKLGVRSQREAVVEAVRCGWSPSSGGD